MPDVSKEQRDIKHNYKGFLTPQVDPGSHIRVDFQISYAIALLYHAGRCHASKNHTGNFQQMPVLSLEGARGE